MATTKKSARPAAKTTSARSTPKKTAPRARASKPKRTAKAAPKPGLSRQLIQLKRRGASLVSQLSKSLSKNGAATKKSKAASAKS